MNSIRNIAFILLITTNFYAQVSAIKGTVKDKITDVPMIGAVVSILKDTTLTDGVQSDENGLYRIAQIAPGRYQLVVTYLGYKTITIPNVLVTSGKEAVIDIGLEEDMTVLSEVVVSAAVDKDKTINELATISARTFSLEEVSRYSGGRNDASRLVSNFAGVATTNDNRNDIVVRGNSPAGILWRLEGISIPNPNHFSTLGTTGGPVSALNTNLLKDSDFLTSAFPSEYGNALSGVFDVGFRSGNKDKHEFTAQLAAFSGLEAMAEGPLGKGKDKSYLVSYRYSFVQLAHTIGLEFGTNATPKYQDLTFNFDLGKTSIGQIKIFGIVARSDIEFKGQELTEEDFFSTRDQDSRAQSNINIFGLRHSVLLNDKNYIKTSIAYSNAGNKYNEYRYRDTTYSSGYTYTDVNDQSPRFSINTYLNSKYNAALSSRIGVNYDIRQLKSTVDNRDFPIDIDNDGLNDFIRIRDLDQQLSTVEPYATMRLKFKNKWTMIAGLHGMIQSFNTKSAIEPRMSINYQLTGRTTLNIGYGLHSQTQPLPVLFLKSYDTDGQLKALNADLDLAKAHHIVVGTDVIPGDQWRIKTELYYQHLYNIAVERKNSSFSILNAGADFVFPQVGNLINNGKGRNYGIELTIEKFFSRQYYGLLTTSIFESKYIGSDGIERNTAFNNKFVFNLLGGKEWTIGENSVLTTDFKFTNAGGRFATPIDLVQSAKQNAEVLITDKAFSEQLKSYLRLDFKIGIRMNNKGFSQQFSLDFQNITNNKNIFANRYNRVTKEVNTLYQIGFFPDILWRIQF